MTSHAHESLHFTRRLHEPVPAQVTVHGPRPHTTSSAQASSPLHWTSHVDASPHTTLRSHARSPQTTRHGTFGGHATSIGHASGALQSITHTPPTQLPFGQPSSHRLFASGDVASAPPSKVTSAQPVSADVAHQPAGVHTCPPAQAPALAHATVQSRSDGE